MASTLVRKVLLRIAADDGDTEVKLDRISVKADELAARHPELKVRIDTAAASAKLAVLREEIKRTAKDVTVTVDERAGKFGLLGRLLYGELGSGGGGAGGAGGLASLAEGGLMSPLGIGGLAAAVAAALPELAGLAAGFAAATAGAGAFGLLALPTFTKIKTAYTGITAAQQKYQAALALQKEDPTKSHATAAAAALVKLRVAQESMAPSTRQAVSGIQELMATYDRMAKAFQPVAMKVFNDGLKIANSLLPALKPLADAAGAAIDGLLRKAAVFTRSKGFQDWLRQFTALAGPAITAIGTGLGKATIEFGKLLTIMSKKDVVHAINIAFGVVIGTLKAVGAAVRWLMRTWDTSERNFIRYWHNVRQWTLDGWHVIDQVIRNIVHAYGNWEHAGANLTHAFGNVRDFIGTAMHRISAAVSQGVTAAANWFRALPGRILAALAALPGMLFRAGANAIRSLIGGFTSQHAGVASAGYSIASKVAGFFGLSPAREGPLSGGGSPRIRGQHFAADFAAGMGDRVPAVTASAGRVASAAGSAHGYGRGLAGAGGRGGVLQVEWVGGGGADAEFITWLKRHIRIRGGDPAVLGR